MSEAFPNGINFYLYLLISFLVGCSDENKYQPINEDFCASIHISDTTRLSHYLTPLRVSFSWALGRVKCSALLKIFGKVR